MPFVNIVKAFRLTQDNGVSRWFNAGRHEVEQFVADHWFVRAHSDNPPPAQAPPGSPEAVLREFEAARAAAEAQTKAAVEAEAAAAETAKANAKALAKRTADTLAERADTASESTTLRLKAKDA